MGEVAEAMLDGTLCCQCGEFRGGDEGYPVACAGCGGPDHTDNQYSNRKNKRASNREFGHDKLTELKIPFQYKNDGAHLIVSGPNGLVDFWPGTGKWKVRADGATDRGIRKLIKYITGIQN